MPTILTPEELKARFLFQRKTMAWYDAVLLYHKLRVHADGELPIHLIKNARPNESEEVRAYREKIYEAETQNPVERVIGVLEKIRRSPDWMMRFEGDIPAIITKEETLEEYVVNNYPVYKSFTNWLFEEALRNVAIDANAVCIVMPQALTVEPNEYIKPIAQIFNAPKVIDFIPDDYVIVKSDEYSSLLDSNNQQARAQNDNIRQALAERWGESTENYLVLTSYATVSQVYYYVDTTVYQKWEERPDGKYEVTQELFHNLGELPAFQLPGKFSKRMGKNVVKKTPLHPMVPHLNKAARESNDLDAGVIMHLYLEKWEINNIECKDCRGLGTTPTPAGPTECKTCKGTGMGSNRSPFGTVKIKPAAIGQQNVPTPPLGYVQKDTKIIELQNERIKEHIQKALEAVNMDHLGDTQMNQSGVAKQFDRDEVNNLIYLFAESLVFVADTSIYFMNELRYKNVVADNEKRRKMLPNIPVPEKYDVVNTTFLIGEYQTAKTAGLNSTILAELQKEVASKKFYANPAVAWRIETVMDLDPFPDKTIEEKSLLEAQQLATKEDVILSNYISDFISQAMENDANFLEKTKTQKREILLKLAQAKVDLLSTAKVIAMDIFQPSAQQQQADNQMKSFNQDTRLMTGVKNAKV
jgi:hypothetical protein